MPKSVQPTGSGRPRSATSSWIVSIGFGAYLLCLFLLHSHRIQDFVTAAVICIGAVAVVNLTLDIFFLKVHIRANTGLDWSRATPSWERTWIKFLGLLGSLGFVGGIYWLFPEYRGDFYDAFWVLLQRILPWWLILAIPYFYWLDARQSQPKDGYYQMGLAVTGRWAAIQRPELVQHLLGWLVKGYFMPLMFIYFIKDLRTFILFNFADIHDFKGLFDFTYDFAWQLDVGLCCVGYLTTLRLFDTHIRSTEPTIKGWVVALFCYEPFWSFISSNYIGFEGKFAWGTWLHNYPVVFTVWGSMILVLVGIYVWATVMFGCRFSNLTHRGILTNGPYRWVKHPAYVSKNLAWWLIAVPFVVSDNVFDSLRRCVMLLFLNWIYFLRARTEESHLSRDPDYVAYARWIQEHGLLCRLRSRFPSPQLPTGKQPNRK